MFLPLLAAARQQKSNVFWEKSGFSHRCHGEPQTGLAAKDPDNEIFGTSPMGQLKAGLRGGPAAVAGAGGR